MKTKTLFRNAILGACLLTLFTACEETETTTDEIDDEIDEVEGRTYFNISAKFDDDDSEVYIAPVTDLSTGSLTFEGNGMKLPAVRSARVMANSANVYNFNYGGGLLYQYENNSDGSTYTQLKEIDLTLAMGGVAYVRPTMINDETILVHNIVRSVDAEDSSSISSMYVTQVSIPSTTISAIMTPYVIPDTTWDVEEDAYVSRVDVPTVLGDKIYYGVSRKANGDNALTGVHTIVLDYPTLKNPQYIRSELANGNTNGYRGANAHAIDGYVYQANKAASADEAQVLVRLKDGAYDEDYVFDISAALGEEICSNNWYYAGDGIAYMPVQYFSPEDPDNDWGVARLDINNKTAVMMNVPTSDLFQYQNGVVDDGKFYMAISPVGGDAYVYGFDISSDDPDAFETGLELDKGNIFIQGIY